MKKTRFQLHVERWQDCTLCELHESRSKVVLLRGRIPCDILFVGEAPGFSENSIGKPFCGPAGRLLDWIVSEAIPVEEETLLPRFQTAFTNLVACMPVDEEGDKNSQPPDKCVEACKPRLKEIIEICNPRMVVAVGAEARKYLEHWLPPRYKRGLQLGRTIPMLSMTHPAAILRGNMAQRDLSTQRCVVQLRNAIEEWLI